MPSSAFCSKCGDKLGDGALTKLCPRCLSEEARAVFSPETPETTVPNVEENPSFASPDGLSGATVHYLGDYKLQKLIGRGGVGEVYLARQMTLDRTVAVKVLRPEIAEAPNVKLRFQNEARLASQLNHDNIVTVHESGEHEGRLFYSMDFVEGKSLAEMVKDGPIPAKDAARYMEIVARAVHFAHEKNVIHRDIKPGNILIDAGNHPRVTDFGMAKDLKSATTLTQTNQLVGTINYMPPEQISPDYGKIGPRSDVYSIGATLYQLLTGQPPFVAESPPATLELIKTKEPVPLRGHNPQLPQDLETICLKCLEKAPRQRYDSALALADDLGRFLQNRPIQARTPTRLDRSLKWGRRNPGWAVSLTLALITVASVVGLLIWHNSRLKNQIHQSLLSEAKAHLALKDRQSALDAIKTAAAIKRTPALRQQAIEAIWEPHAQLVTKIKCSGEADQIAFSFDGKSVAVQANFQQSTFGMDISTGHLPEPHEIKGITVWDLDTGRLTASTPIFQKWEAFAWCPTSPVLATIRGISNISTHPHVALWSPIEKKDIFLLTAVGRPFFSPNGKYLAVSETNDIKVFEAATGRLTGHRTDGVAFAFVASDCLLLQESNRILTWNPVEGFEKTLLPTKCKVLAVSGDGHFFAYTNYVNRVV